jgi:hypothetical protein
MDVSINNWADPQLGLVGERALGVCLTECKRQSQRIGKGTAGAFKFSVLLAEEESIMRPLPRSLGSILMYIVAQKLKKRLG